MPYVEKVIRLPLIPGYNDDEDNIESTARFVRSLDIRQIDLLPFNELAGKKHEMMGGETWIYSKVTPQPEKKWHCKQ